MEAWAQSLPDAQFFCVCVDSKRVALQFGQMLDFTHAYNCWIPAKEYFPKFGQLGCSGFIIADAQGNYVSRRTSAFLQYGEGAFRHVEQILLPLIQQNRGNVPANSSSQQVSIPRIGQGKDEEARSTSLTSVPSVGVESMDEEHEECSVALRELNTTPSKDNLQRVLDVLELHFAHEETLMQAFAFGGSVNDSFSALTSHTKDHRRILDIARNELGRISATSPEAACATSSS